jgi:hypothetical protein
MKAAILLSVVSIMFMACSRQPVMTIDKVSLQGQIGGDSLNKGYSPNPGFEFLIVSATLDFGAKTTLSTEDMSVFSSGGPSYKAIGSDIPARHPDVGGLMTEEEYSRRPVAMGIGESTSDDGKFNVKFVFAIPTEARDQTLGLSYRRGLPVMLSIK